METMTQADFARRHDVSRKTVTKWKQSGLIVMAGELVDVGASDERLRKYRFAADGRAQRGPAKKFHDRFDRPPLPARGVARLKTAQILARLRALDWVQDLDWSEDAQAERARLAAKCIGFEAVQSDLRDDGHWGEFQLRDPRWIRNGELRDGSVVAGYGFELSALEVLRICRAEVTPDDEDDSDFELTVDVSLLPLLAYPHYEDDRPQEAGV